MFKSSHPSHMFMSVEVFSDQWWGDQHISSSSPTVHSEGIDMRRICNGIDIVSHRRPLVTRSLDVKKCQIPRSARHNKAERLEPQPSMSRELECVRLLAIYTANVLLPDSLSHNRIQCSHTSAPIGHRRCHPRRRGCSSDGFASSTAASCWSGRRKPRVSEIEVTVV